MDVLLVDDDPVMHVIVEKMLHVLTQGACNLVKVMEWAEASRHFNSRRFDLILLDNNLSRSVTAQVTVPLIRKSRYRSPIAVISSDVSVDYLSHPSILGVNYIVDKVRLTKFLKDQVSLVDLLH